MIKSCTFFPKKGGKLFKELRTNFGYTPAREVYVRIMHPNFTRKYKDTLTLDSEGIPSFKSLMRIPDLKKFLGERKVKDSLEKYFPVYSNNINEYEYAVEEAKRYNLDSTSDYIAVVEENSDKLNIKLYDKTEESIKRANEQYTTIKLNKRLSELFSPIGITVGHLTKAEMSAGSVGLTDFSKAKSIAKDFTSIIRVANNLEGAEAISEEFAHLVVGIFRDKPLIQRSINTLVNREDVITKVLGEDLFNEYYELYNGNIELIAEEAVGHLLRKNFLKETTIKDTPSPSLFRRAFDFIINQFKQFKLTDVEKAINDVDSSLSYLATKVLRGDIKITDKDVENINRDSAFNALSSKVSRNMNILKGAIRTEMKKLKIFDEKDPIRVENIDRMKTQLLDESRTVLGIMEYAKNALESLRTSSKMLYTIQHYPSDKDFKTLRVVKANIESYNDFISMMRAALQEDRQSTESDRDSNDLFWNKLVIDGEEVNIKSVIDQLYVLSSEVESDFFKLSSDRFVEFLKPFLGENIKVPFGKDKGKIITAESLLEKATKDITFMDRWIDSMAESSDILLQLFDKSVKQAKDRARQNTIKYSKEIEELRIFAEKSGITDFEWMFETDDEGNKTGYMVSQYDWGRYNTSYLKLLESLDEKYGKNPSGKDLESRNKEIYLWHKDNSLPHESGNIPKYKSKQWEKLTTKQKDILLEWNRIKTELDKKYPEGKVIGPKAVQIRKNLADRIATSGSLNQAYENIKEAIQDSFLERVDDDTLFGTSTGLQDFKGREFMTLPILYTRLLENPNDISTDVFASLNAYAFATNTYEEVNEIIDPLEVGRTLVLEKRKIEQTRGNKSVTERIRAFGNEVTSNILKTGNININAKLNDFFESQIYLRHYKDEGTFDILGKAISVNKATSQLLKYSSLAQLGFNWLSNIANAANGLAMTNIEVSAGQFFNKGTLLSADKTYSKELLSMVSEIGKRNKTNKLDLFGELFNVKQDFEIKIKDPKMNGLLKRMFGENIAYLGQSAGDHWLYYRVAIAMALETKVKVPGKKDPISLWDALKIEDFSENSEVKILALPKGTTTLDGNPFSVNDFSRKIAGVNQHLFGIYNQEDSNAANRVAVGRLLMQYRKWMKPLYNKRFMAAQYDSSLDTYTEGYYRTFYRFANELMRGKFQIMATWDNLTDYEKGNIKRVIMEVAQLMAVYAITLLLDGDDDKELKSRTHAYKMLDYTFTRLYHELATLTPTLSMGRELVKTVRTPVASASAINNMLNLCVSITKPYSDWTDEIQSGPYKGMSTLEKNFLKAPIPGIAQYKQIERFIGDLDTSINYYARPW